MPRFEYQMSFIRYARSHQRLVDELNATAEDGWRVLDIKWDQGHEHCDVLWEREQQTEQQASANGEEEAAR